MINLLPPDTKRHLRAGRTNTLLLRYNFLLIGAAAFAFAAVVVVNIYLTTTKDNAKQIIATNESNLRQYAPVAEDAKKFRTNLSISKQILDRETNYSDIVLKIAAIVPPNVILTNLNLDAKTFGTSTTIEAESKTYEDAIKLKTAFENSQLFSDVYFQSIVAANEDSAYAYTFSINATISKEAE